MRSVRGFTLLEVMIVCAVVAILAVIAYPSYQNQLMKGRRAAAEGYLMDLAQRQQQYLLDQRAYASTESALGYTSTPAEVSSYYNITIALIPGPPPGFTITASPSGVQVADGSLSLDYNGNKTPPDKW